MPVLAMGQPASPHEYDVASRILYGEMDSLGARHVFSSTKREGY
jgi:hypothetical protein